MSAQPGSQGGVSRIHAAHSVDASTWRSRGGADEDLGVWRRVRIEADDGPRNQPAKVHAAAHHVAADAVGLLRLDPACGPCAALADHITKARGESLDLV